MLRKIYDVQSDIVIVCHDENRRCHSEKKLKMLLVHCSAGTIVPMPQRLARGMVHGHLCLLPSDYQHVYKVKAKDDVVRKEDIVIGALLVFVIFTLLLCYDK